MRLPIESRKDYFSEENGVRLEHMFSFYDKDTHDHMAVMVGDPEGEPYIVQIHEPGYYWMSILIFAASEEDARERVGYGLQVLAAQAEDQLKKFLETARPNSRAPHHYEEALEWRNWERNRAFKMLNLLHSEHCNIRKFDKRFVAKVPWATNDTIV